MAEVLTIRIDAKSKKRLEKLAKATARTKSYLAAQAVRNYLDLNEWQIAEIKKGIDAADRGEFASDAEVERVFAKIRGNAR
ncbi:MAG TPA: ribbon-helix-helix protein, CopG family [Candidatus Binataceae bacterium]|nr:ribbon-helix-helix protein, CopG family [Candidatus Binataceae bacterium]